jgi:hypothetical protein
MATLITYTDKEQGKVSTLPVTKKYRYQDANEVKTAVNANAAETDTNTANIATNVTNIGTNATNIATNASGISNNSTQGSTNATNISTNASGVSTNSSSISTNATNIGTNTSAISTNASGVSSNASSISTNATNIASNTTALASKADLVTGKVPLSQLPPILDIAGLPTITEAPANSVVPIVSTAGVISKIDVSDLTNEYIRKAEHSVLAITTSQTINLSTTFSLNIIRVLNPGLTLTLQFPVSPVESQICEFTTLTNTVTLIVGTGGTYTLDPSFAGAPTAGYAATYVYHEEDDTWYKVGS